MSFEIKNKRILILSPCDWSDFQVSKHHYAKELAKRNNDVLFLEWPTFSSTKKNKKIKIQENLHVLRIYFFFSKKIYFHAKWIYYFFLKLKIKSILRDVDIIWSFDNTERYSLKFFSKSKLKIYHPVDTGDEQILKENADYANYIFSCSNDIVNLLSKDRKSVKFINHGLSSYFTNPIEKVNYLNGKIKIAISGNLAVPQLDYENLLSIITQNTNIEFIFFGKKDLTGNEDDFIKKGVSELKKQPNCIFKGIIHPSELAKELNLVDAFLFCYKMDRLNRGNNSHKLLEYLSTGKVIIAAYLDLYYDSGLFSMLPDIDNSNLPKLFNDTINNLKKNNSQNLQQKRIQYALNNTYKKQIDRIERIINGK